ncbi:MAG: cysteine hydrolase [Rhizobacter sp.]|nr:cysteine hydrolase [Rhizobacter sp.]
MNRSAVLMLDLQVDFLDLQRGKMPVDAAGALRVIAAANAVLRDEALPGALRVLIVNAFPPSATIANFFRRGAAVDGSAGAAVDPRIAVRPGVRCFTKESSSAFTHPDLDPWLRAEGVTTLWMLGVFAEGCVRATALDARRRGFDVIVPTTAIATNASWKAAFAHWALRRAGVKLRRDLDRDLDEAPRS